MYRMQLLLFLFITVISSSCLAQPITIEIEQLKQIARVMPLTIPNFLLTFGATYALIKTIKTAMRYTEHFLALQLLTFFFGKANTNPLHQNLCSTKKGYELIIGLGLIIGLAILKKRYYNSLQIRTLLINNISNAFRLTDQQDYSLRIASASGFLMAIAYAMHHCPEWNK